MMKILSNKLLPWEFDQQWVDLPQLHHALNPLDRNILHGSPDRPHYAGADRGKQDHVQYQRPQRRHSSHGREFRMLFELEIKLKIEFF